jgi:TolB-like protein/class 3 adenylate cyclase
MAGGGEDRTERRLAAILAGDVAGYSRLMGLDEEGTLAQLKAHRRQLVDPKIKEHRGRIVKTTGDGMLVEFASVVDAVRCAADIQVGMVERNVDVPPERRIQFRIGINVGDIIIDGGDIFGDGVNIAARLEALAEPGEIWASRVVREQVRDKLAFAFEDMGEREVKNIARPIRVCRIVPKGGGPAETPHRAATPAAPAKPSIAVLPFANMSGDPEQEYFADGMVEDIITALSRFSQLFVIARNSSFTYKGRAVDVRQVAKELGVRYVLEGSVRKAGSRVRITGQLIEAATGTHLWADKFDGALDDVFELQDKITASVVGAIEPTLRKAEIERARRKPAENLDAYDLYLRALPLVHAFRPDDNLTAHGLLMRAIELAPNYGPALAYAAWAHEQRIVRGWPRIGPDDDAAATALARRALTTANDDAIVLAVGGFVVLMVGRDYDAGLDALGRAAAHNPDSALVALLAAAGTLFGGEPDDAIAHAERAMMLSPSDPGMFMPMSLAGIGHLLAGRPEKALELTRRSAGLYPDWDSTYWGMVAAYGLLDRAAEAGPAVAKLLSLSPGSTLSGLRQRLPLRNPAAIELMIEACRRAGLPE